MRTIQRIEAGNIPKGFTLKTIAKALETESENLFQGNEKLREGSGGDYLSNEIMYRATKKRDEMGLHNSKAVGHVHIANNLNPKEFLDIITKIIYNASK